MATKQQQRVDFTMVKKNVKNHYCVKIVSVSITEFVGTPLQFALASPSSRAWGALWEELRVRGKVGGQGSEAETVNTDLQRTNAPKDRWKAEDRCFSLSEDRKSSSAGS